ncbi:MAG: hypothetical protein V3V00_04510 [Saprospiraceae bacterium]
MGFNLKNTAYLDKTKFVQTDQGSVLVTDRIDPFLSNVNEFEIGWSIGGGLEYALNGNHSMFLEIQYTKGANSNQKSSKFYISQKAVVLLIGVSF